MKILILCQRKQSTVDTDKLLKANNNIKAFVESIYPFSNHDYTFLTDCPREKNTCAADVKMNFDMMNEQTQNWVNINIGSFDLIIMNTCPVSLFRVDFWYGMYKLLKVNSRLYITNFSSNGGLNITSDVFIDGAEKMTIIQPVKGEPLKAVNVLFDVSFGDFLLKNNEKENPVIFTYLIKQSCHRIREIYPILPEYIQKIIINICETALQNSDKLKLSSSTKKLLQDVTTI